MIHTRNAGRTAQYGFIQQARQDIRLSGGQVNRWGDAGCRGCFTSLSSISDYADVTVGQFKIPIGYEAYNSTAQLVMPEFSLVTRYYSARRDIGVKVDKKLGKHFYYPRLRPRAATLRRRLRLRAPTLRLSGHLRSAGQLLTLGQRVGSRLGTRAIGGTERGFQKVLQLTLTRCYLMGRWPKRARNWW